MSSPSPDGAAARPTFQHSRHQLWQLQPTAAAAPAPTFSAGQVVNGQFQLHTQLHQGPRSSVWRAVCTATTGAAAQATAGSLPTAADTNSKHAAPQEVVLKFLPTATPEQQQAARQELASTTAVTAAAAATPHTTPVCGHTSPVSCLVSSFHLDHPTTAASASPAAAAAAPGDGMGGSSLVLVLSPAHEPLATLLAYQRSRGRAGLPTPAVLQLARCGLQALDIAHRQAGVAHLDVKPANLLLATPFLRPAQHQHSRQQGLDNQQVQEEEQQQKQEQGQGQHSHRPGLKQGPGWRSPSAAELASARWVLVDWGSAARLTPAAPSPAALASVEHAKERQTPAAVGADGLPTSSWWRGAALSAMQQPHHHMSPKAADAGVVLGRPGYDTPAYAAPEVLLQGVLTPAADMWSLGATLFEAATGVPLLQLPTRGPALGALLTWLQQQQQQGDSSLGLSVGHSRQEVAAAHPAAGASNSSSSSSSVNVEELVDGSQLALMEALAAGSSSSSSSPALFEWPQPLAASAAAPTWLTATRLLRRPWDGLAADAQRQLATATGAAAGGAAASGQGSPVWPSGSSSWRPGVYWGWRWPWQLQQGTRFLQQQQEEEEQWAGLPVQPLRVLLQAGRGLRAGPPAAGRQGRQLEYEEAVQLAGLLAPMLALDPAARPAPAALLRHPALQWEQGEPGAGGRPG